MLEQNSKTQKLQEEINEMYSVYPETEQDMAFSVEVARLRAELELAESIEKGIADLKDRNKKHGKVAAGSGENILESVYKVVPKRTGTWITRESDITLSPKLSQAGKRFWLGRTTELSHATRLVGSPNIEGAIGEISDIIASHIGLKLDAPDSRVRALRPLSRDDLTRQHTTLNAYSDDAINPEGFRANDLRALVLEDTTQEDTRNGIPVYLIASVCPHSEDGPKIYKL